MTTDIQDFIERFDLLRDQLKEAIQGMSGEELNWRPLGEDTSSPWVLVTHICGNWGFWVHQVVGGIDVRRDRDAEFTAKGTEVAELEALVDRTSETTHKVLRGLSGDDLGETREPRPGATPVTLRRAMLNCLTHVHEHLGHLGMTKQLYEERER